MNSADRYSPLYGAAVLATSVLCWGMVPPMLKAVTEYLDPWTVNAIRYPFASLLWLGPLIYQYRAGKIDARIWKMALIPTLFNIPAQALWAAIPYYLDATRMAFLVRISVVFSIAGGFWFFPDERRLMRHPLFWLGAILSLAGFTVMSLGGKTLSDDTSTIGIILVLLCGANYGLYAVAVRYSLQGSRPWVAFPVISIYTSVGLVILGGVFGEPSRLADVPWEWMLLIAFSAFVGIAAAHTLFYMAIEHVGVAISACSQLASPFITYLGAFLFLGETITLFQWIGGTVLLSGGFLLIRSQWTFTPESMDPTKAPIEPRVSD